MKNKATSFINIGRLSVGVAVAIIIILCVADEYGYNKFHDKLPEITLMMQHDKQGTEVYSSQSVPGPLAAVLRSEIPIDKSSPGKPC